MKWRRNIICILIINTINVNPGEEKKYSEFELGLSLITSVNYTRFSLYSTIYIFINLDNRSMKMIQNFLTLNGFANESMTSSNISWISECRLEFMFKLSL